MTRYFTVEDLRRTGGGDVVVPEGTVVTPQALAAANSAGIKLRGAAGEYVEPAPDRGPEAQRSRATLPHLPEPIDAGEGTGVVVTVVGRDRAGVLAEVTAALGEAGINVHDISQKTIEGYFHLMLTVELRPDADFGSVKERLECLGGPDDYVVRVMHERVFRFMHRI
jgi:ACT domain-containing protein